MKELLQKKRAEGFTIIEVMIVLAIAGLIMLIVFLAVPALQRNSRNTQYKNDAASYGSAVSEWMNNNQGKLPASATDLSAVASLAKLGTMTAPTAVKTGAQTAAPTLGTLELDTNAKCDSTNVGQSISVASRAAAVRYSVEDSSGSPVMQCLDV